MNDSLTRNNLPWDEKYQYSWVDKNDLLEHFFPEAKREIEYLDIISVALDEDRGARVKAALKGLKSNHTNIAIFHLSITNPFGEKDDKGNYKTHDVMLAVDTEKQEIFYQDPYGIGMDEREWDKFKPEEKANAPKLNDMIYATLPGYKITQPRYRQQSDSYSSAPITITNMLYYSRTGTVPEKVDVSAVRSSHKQIILAADAMREEMLMKKYQVNISTVAREVATQAMKDSFFNKEEAEALEIKINALLTENCRKTKNPAYATLSDIRIPPQPTRSGRNFATSLYKALGNLRTASGLVDTSKLDDEKFCGSLHAVINSSLKTPNSNAMVFARAMSAPV